MTSRIDSDGRWENSGGVWLLVEPSPLFNAVRTGIRNVDGTVDQDNGDGTGTRTTYTPDGEVDTVEQLTGLPIAVPPEPTAEERLATLIAALTDAQSLEEIRDAAAAAGGQ